MTTAGQYPTTNGHIFNPRDPRHWLAAARRTDRNDFDYALVQYQHLRHKFNTGKIPSASHAQYEKTMLHFYNRLERDIRRSL